MDSCIKIIEFNMNTKTLHEPLYIMDYIISDVRKLTKIFLNSTTFHINIINNNRTISRILLSAVILHSIVLTRTKWLVYEYGRVFIVCSYPICVKSCIRFNGRNEDVQIWLHGQHGSNVILRLLSTSKCQ